MSAATVGAVAAAGGLGQPILAGLTTYNTALIIEGSAAGRGSRLAGGSRANTTRKRTKV